MKKMIALVAVLALSLSLFGCGNNKKDPNNDPSGDITKNPDGSIDLPMIDVDFD